ncbi:Acyl transferase/acyl hydrolase/lysophospholipase [Penicillium concentricum]|uniref:Lysophospholipase n=1 Tax=Penicillium concentricum TaxID=293559 RepID=A0A9W9SBS2_9EURO|nr:Acyl transferase/acyl hydrolase/lysophospholipase [Penicillium concentricum]KAJ5375726.1 Acyl transferase/acyl hydrolase/lysophospholipase [Penicillium concentricum]
MQQASYLAFNSPSTMCAARVTRLKWTVPPAALAAYTAGELSHPRKSRAQFTTSQTRNSNDSESNNSNAGSDGGEDAKDHGSIWNKLDGVKQTVTSGEWADVGHITDYIIPDWTKFLPATAQKLQRELSLSPGSLADDIWKEAHDPHINPEILRDAEVRVSGDLCDEEQTFRRQRQRKVVKALSSYLNIPEEDIHPEDVPVIAICGSGGGLRALVAGTGSYLAAQEAGLWDCITYTAGVSGSCWLQTLYHSSIAQRDFDKLVDHLKNRLGVHFAFPPEALNLLTTAPTNKYLLSGFVEKLKGDPGADFGLVDIYGLLLAARLLVPRGELGVSDMDFKLSNQRANLVNGAHPLPIYTAVRHEIPVDALNHSNDQGKKQPTPEQLVKESQSEAWFQWFEFTPYEFFCEELNAGIPTWALGRHFNAGRSEISADNLPIPELRVPNLMGVWGSAFCATLSHYYKEIRPLVRGLAGFSGIDSIIQGKNQDLIKVHPIDPAGIPNYVMGMKDQLADSCPESIFRNPHLRLMDAGMSNNLPIYPLIRPGRDVDVIVAFDASADVKQENWLSVVDGYARQRGVKGWPVGAGWPKNSSLKETEEALREPEHITEEQLTKKLAEAKNKSGNQPADQKPKSGTDLGYCNVWVGTTEERTSDDEPPPSKRLFDSSHSEDHSESEFHLMRPDAGIAVIYFPLIPNPSAPDIPLKPKTRPRAAAQSMRQDSSQTKDPELPLAPQPNSIDPAVDDFLSTWNFIYTPEQIDSVVGLAKANFAEGEEQTRRVVRAVYERKKSDRLEKEATEHRKKMEGFVPL